MAAASGITGKATQPLQVAGKSNAQGFHYITTNQLTSSYRYELQRTAGLRDRLRHLEHFGDEPTSKMPAEAARRYLRWRVVTIKWHTQRVYFNTT